MLDWGVLVPLSFLKARQIVSLSIVSAYDEHRTLGQLVRRCAEELGRDTLFLASGDLSHALTHGAPAPYDPRGKLFDDEVVRLLGGRRLRRRSGAWTRILLEGAAECGLRSFIALGGFLGDDAQVAPRDPQLRGAVRRRLPGRAFRRAPARGAQREAGA